MQESTSSDNKDNDAVTTQAHFAEVTDTLDEAMHFTVTSIIENDPEASVSTTQKMCMKLTEAMIKFSFDRRCDMSFKARTTQQDSNSEVIELMLVLCKEKLKESERQKENIFLCSVTVNSIVSAISALSLNELNHNKQQNSLL
jgi:hypothetical protein